MAASESDKPFVRAVVGWECASRPVSLKGLTLQWVPLISRRGELSVEVLRGRSRRFEMNPLLMFYFSAGTSFAVLGLVKLQARLERWAYERHAQD